MTYAKFNAPVEGHFRILYSNPQETRLQILEELPITTEARNPVDMPRLSPRKPVLSRDNKVIVSVEASSPIAKKVYDIQIPIMVKTENGVERYTRYLTKDTCDYLKSYEGSEIDSTSVATPNDDKGEKDFREIIKPEDLDSGNPRPLSELERWWHS
jgi:hypothetical protein